MIEITLTLHTYLYYLYAAVSDTFDSFITPLCHANSTNYQYSLSDDMQDRYLV